MREQYFLKDRSDIPKHANRVVIKVGTSSLIHEEGGFRYSRFYSFIESVAALKAQGRDVILVTSGAVGLGAQTLKIFSRNGDLREKQACAAVGQGRLMSLYSDAFDRFGITAAQLLLIEEDFSNRRRYLNLRGALLKLLELGTVPVVNENDTVSTDELETPYHKANFGDNDKLSALVASKIEADLLLILTDVDGLYSGGDLVSFVDEITPEIKKWVRSDRSKIGRGGMKTKLEAAEVASRSGCATVMAGARVPEIIEKVFAGENIGTFFAPLGMLKGKRRWIAYATTVKAALVVNEGARRALVKEQASLLPAGVVRVSGDFERGDVISILDEEDREFARGIVNYSSAEAKRVAGKHTKKISELIDNPNYNELIKSENIAILGGSRE